VAAGDSEGMTARATKPYFATSFETGFRDAGRPDPRGSAPCRKTYPF
jgi:hypothetical protein